MHALLAIAAFCIAQQPEALRPIDVRSTIHVEGVVVDAKGLPLDGVEVRWYLIAIDEKNFRPEPTRTDSQGRFVLEAKTVDRPDLLRMRLEHPLEPSFCLIRPGFAFTRVAVRPEWLSGEPARIVLPVAEELAVRVLDPTGAPVSGATVSVDGYPRRDLDKDQLDPDVPPPSKTDNQGRARIDGVNRAQVRVITVETPAFGRQDYRVSDGMALPEELVLPLRPVGRLVGRALADNPTAVQGARAILTDFTALQSELKLTSGLQPIGVVLVKTDDEGKFEVPTLPEGEWGVMVSSNDDLGYSYKSEHVTVEPGKTTEVSVRRERGIMVRGLLRDRATGRPLAHAALRLRTTPPSRGSGMTHTDGSGRFRVLGGPGRVSVNLEQGGDFCLPVTRPIDFAEIPADAHEFDLPPIEAERGRRISGLIVNENAEPSGPGRVLACWIDYPGTPSARLVETEVAVDKDGRFVLHAIPPETRFFITAFTADGSSGPPFEIEKYGPCPRKVPFMAYRTEAMMGPGPIRRDLFFPRLPDLQAPKLHLDQDRAPELVDPVQILAPSRGRFQGRSPVVGPTGILRFDPTERKVPDQLCLPVFKGQLRAIDGRAVDALGHPVVGARVRIHATGALPGGITWIDTTLIYDSIHVLTDEKGHFQTPRLVPAFTNLKANIQGEGIQIGGIMSSQYAPTTPSFFDVGVIRSPTPPSEKPVWDLVEKALEARNQAAFAAAQRWFSDALKAADQLDLKDPLIRAYILAQQAEACAESRQYNDARSLYKQALDLRRAALGDDDPLVITLYNELAYANMRSKHYPQMLEDLKAVQKWRPDHPIHPLKARAYLISGEFYTSIRRFADAEKRIAVAQSFLESIYSPTSPELITPLASHARSLMDLNRPSHSEPLVRRAVAIANANHYDRYPVGQPVLASLLEQHAHVLKTLHRTADAQTAANRAKAIRARKQPSTVQ